MVTKAEFLFIIQSVNQPPSTHSVHTHCSSHYIFSAHCSHVQPCTAICSQPSVHTAAILSSAHCSYTIQCTLQLHYLVPILCIQCTSGPPQGKLIPLLAYLQSSQQALIQWLIVAVHKMKKTG